MASRPSLSRASFRVYGGSPSRNQRRDDDSLDGMTPSSHKDENLYRKRKDRSGEEDSGNNSICHKRKGSSPVVVDVSHKFNIGKDDSKPIKNGPSQGTQEKTLEKDSHRLSQRQRQVDYGKNTLGYERYLELVPRHKRRKADPKTPEIHQICSKRSWDGQVRAWRRRLHFYDPPVTEDEELPQELGLPKKLEDKNDNEVHEVDITEKPCEDYQESMYGEWLEEP